MNAFVVSPGRTGTLALSHALGLLDGYSSGHESRVQRLGDDRVAYPPMHVECDNRLTWFLPRLTSRYSESGVLAIVHRDRESIARSYDKRWTKINMMKAYSQGVLLRDFSQNGMDVCRDYVDVVYEQLEFARSRWTTVIDVDIESPDVGIGALLAALDRDHQLDDVLTFLRDHQLNTSVFPLKERLSELKFTTRNLSWDVLQLFR